MGCQLEDTSEDTHWQIGSAVIHKRLGLAGRQDCENDITSQHERAKHLTDADGNFSTIAFTSQL